MPLNSLIPHPDGTHWLLSKDDAADIVVYIAAYKARDAAASACLVKP